MSFLSILIRLKSPVIWFCIVYVMFHCCYVGMWIIWFNNEQAMGVYGCRSKVEVWFYIAQYPVSWTAQSALHFSSPDRPVHSDTNPASLGSILAMQQLRNEYSLTCPPLSIARYHFFTAESTEASSRERKCPNFEMVAKGDSNPALSVGSPAFYHWLSYRAPPKGGKDDRLRVSAMTTWHQCWRRSWTSARRMQSMCSRITAKDRRRRSLSPTLTRSKQRMRSRQKWR